MKQFLQSSAAVAAAITLAACATTASTPQGVTLIDAERLSRLISVTQPQVAPTETGTSRSWLGLRNLGKARLMIEGRATFGGAGGQPVEAASAWQRVTIEPESSGTLQFLSMSTAARQVTIELREGNR